jgi:hypothetical protein
MSVSQVGSESRRRPTAEGSASHNAGELSSAESHCHTTLCVNATEPDVELGQTLFGAPLDIGSGRWVAAHPDQGDLPQGVVGPAVAAAIQPVAVGATRGGWDGGGAAQMREGGFGAQPLGVVAGGDQQLASGLDSHPGAGRPARARPR